jgi:hypothetical protein
MEPPDLTEQLVHQAFKAKSEQLVQVAFKAM